MTERLHQILRDEADHLVVPPAPAETVLAAGRRRRRRRSVAAAAAAGALTVAVAGAAVGLGGLDRGGPPPDTASDPAADSGAVFAVGGTVYLDDGAVSTQVADQAVTSLSYTSVGVLVRHGDDPASDDGPQRFSLVRRDRSVSPVSVGTGETTHATDPAQPYLAWAEATPGGAEVVVHDVDTDTEVARVPVPGRFSWSPPPVALDGGTVYVGGGRTTWAVDWRTGEVVDSGLDALLPQVAGGRAVTTDRGGSGVVDVATGEVLLDVPTEDRVFVDVRLSPDGRYALLVPEQDATTLGAEGMEASIVDVGTGATVDLPPEVGQGFPGWTSDGEPFVVAGDTLIACSPVDGACTRTGLETDDLPDPGGSQALRLAGATYES